MATPWMTSDDLVEAVKRKILIPISQNTFSSDDILKFLNEEMMISQVPSVLSFHEEYYVVTKEVTLVSNQKSYPIPDRAIGMRLRDIFYKDDAGNLGEMTRISPEERAFFEKNLGTSQPVTKFYLENNSVVLLPTVSQVPTGSLVFHYFIRPNQLVATTRAATITFFNENITVNNASLVAGNTITIKSIVFTAVSGAPSTNEFQIGASSIATATNLAVAINTNGVCIADNGSPSTNTVKLKFTSLSDSKTVAVSNSSGLAVQAGQAIEFSSIPTVFTNGALVDFLQTKPGHKIRDFDIQIPTNGISGTQINFAADTVPTDLVVGDYICLENECIIPFLPTDLHNGLAEKACSRILAAIGDQAGLQIVNTKLQEIEQRTGSLLDNRVEGAPQKIANHHSLLGYGAMGPKRRGY